MKDVIDLEFCFKGSRKYIQGPDIFDTVIKQLQKEFNNLTNIKYTAYQMLHKNATMHIVKKVIKSNYSIINSLISFVVNDVKYYVVVFDNNEMVKCSKDYSEEIVEQNSIISANVITFKNTLPYSFTELVVSMNKFFLNQTVYEKGKWIVTKFDYYDMDKIVDIENKEVKLELLQNLNNKLTKSQLYLDNEPVGYLYFSLIPKES